jgi:hypothetical protein
MASRALMLYAARSAFHPLRSLSLRASFSDKTLGERQVRLPSSITRALPAAAWWPRTPVIKQKHTGRPINQPLLFLRLAFKLPHATSIIYIALFVVSYFFPTHGQLFVEQGMTNMFGKSAQ